MGSLQSLNMDSKMRQTFITDYSVRAVTDVTYIAIKRSLYLTAKRATLLEKSQRSGNDGGSAEIDDEVEKVTSIILQKNLKEKCLITRFLSVYNKISTLCL